MIPATERTRALRVIASAAAAAFIAACGGSDPSRNVESIVSFGDSLSDVGTHRWGPVEAAGGGRYTTNPGPVWVEQVASSYGLKIDRNRIGGFGAPAPQVLGGYAYGEGGARVTLTPGFGTTPSGTQDVPVESTAMPIRDQIAAHLRALGNAIPPTQLVLVQGGANDAFYQLGVFQASVQQGVTVPVAQQAAVTAMITAATELAGEVDRLLGAGANKLVVATLPDIGLTPFGQSSGPEGQALASGLSKAFNDTLTAALSGKAGVTLVDSNAFFTDAFANPSRYGFTNVSLPACGTLGSLFCTNANLIAPNAQDTFLFADPVHPTTAGHARYAQYLLDRISSRIPVWN